MVIGNRRVPLTLVKLANDEGVFEDHCLADLAVRRMGSDGKLRRASIWDVIGGGCPWKLPLINEIKDAIASLRVRRDGKRCLFRREW